MAIGTGFTDDDETLGFTAHELAYLVGLVPGARADLARQRLGIPDGEPAAAERMLAGASTLMVRGLADVLDEEKIVPDGAAALVAIALNESIGWCEVAFLEEDDGEAAFVAVAAQFSVVLAPRALGISEVRFIEHNGRGPGEVIAGILLAYLQSKTPGAAYVSIVSSTGEQVAAIAARRLVGGEFEFSRDEGEGERWSVPDADTARPRLAAEISDGLDRAS